MPVPAFFTLEVSRALFQAIAADVAIVYLHELVILDKLFAFLAIAVERILAVLADVAAASHGVARLTILDDAATLFAGNDFLFFHYDFLSARFADSTAS
jgi:hypothetical protein